MFSEFLLIVLKKSLVLTQRCYQSAKLKYDNDINSGGKSFVHRIISVFVLKMLKNESRQHHHQTQFDSSSDELSLD